MDGQCSSTRRFPAVATKRSPSGFTLVELLVVIGIIAILAALTTPAVLRARTSAINAKVKAELDMLHMALMNYKNEYGSFPPAYMGDLWDTRSNAVNTKSQAYRHLVRIFPRIDEDKLDKPPKESPYKYLAQLSPPQALVFWLQGFYDNQEYPLTNGSWPPTGRRKKLFDFDETRLYAASVQIPDQPQTFKPIGPSTSNADRMFPVYITPHQTHPLPYVYFDTRAYNDQQRGDLKYLARNGSGSDSMAAPYFTSNPPVNPTFDQLHHNDDTFQLIAGGADGLYGNRPASFPAILKLDPNNQNSWIPAANDPAAAAGHQDNITNFASGTLLDATESSKK